MVLASERGYTIASSRVPFVGFMVLCSMLCRTELKVEL
jgi:hypothetical protein